MDEEAFESKQEKYFKPPLKASQQQMVKIAPVRRA